MGSRPNCSEPGCTDVARVGGRCRLCHGRYYYKVNKARILETQKAYRTRLKRPKPSFIEGRILGPRATATFVAQQAISIAQQSWNLSYQLALLAGWNAPLLAYDMHSMIMLLDELHRPVDWKHLLSSAYLRYWSGVFFRVDQHHFEMVGYLMKTQEPWKLFVDYSRTMLHELQTTCAEHLSRSPDLYLAAQCLDNSRQALTRTSYMYCQKKLGKRVAEGVFGGKPKAVDELWANILH
jgi:hypothetical protein